MSRKSIKGIYTRLMDASASNPVIENEGLPAMSDTASKPESSGSSPNKATMDEATNASPQRDDASDRLMKPFNPDVKVFTDVRTRIEDQQIDDRQQRETGSYVVLRMRVQNGAITVIGSKRVDSALINADDVVQGGLTYEATLNNTRINIGSIADFGEQRSFPKPGGEPGEHGHFFTNVPSFDFNLRLPSEKVSLNDLPKIKISLYRFKEHLPDFKFNPLPLGVQFNKEVRVVAEKDGIHLNELKPDVQELITRAFRQ